MLCVPLPGLQGPIGALYVDDDARREAFDERDVERLVALADQAATTVVHVRRRAEVEALNRPGNNIDVVDEARRERKGALCKSSPARSPISIAPRFANVTSKPRTSSSTVAKTKTHASSSSTSKAWNASKSYPRPANANETSAAWRRASTLRR